MKEVKGVSMMKEVQETLTPEFQRVKYSDIFSHDRKRR